MKNRSKNKLGTETKSKKNSINNSYETVMDELYYSHLLELLFDQGSGNTEFRENRKNGKINKSINKNKKGA